MADIYLKIINGLNVLNISIMKLRFPRSGKARFCIAVFPISVLATMAEKMSLKTLYFRDIISF